MKIKFILSSIVAAIIPKIAYSYFEPNITDCNHLKNIYDTNHELLLKNVNQIHDIYETNNQINNINLLEYLKNNCDDSFLIQETEINSISLGTQDDHVK